MPKFAILLLTSFIGFNIYGANLDIEADEASYKTFCVSFHGDLGPGAGVTGKAPLEQLQNICDELNSQFESEAKLIDTVLNGNEGIPAWNSVLNEKNVKDIFVYIEKINSK